MPEIRESTEVAAPVERVREAWSAFVEWGLVGPKRLTCSELACVNAVQQGTVAFRSERQDATIVVFELDIRNVQRAVAEDQLARDMRHDLLMFKEYVEEHTSQKRRGRHEGEWRSSRESGSDLAPDTARPGARA